MADRGLKPTATFGGRSAIKAKNRRVAGGETGGGARYSTCLNPPGFEPDEIVLHIFFNRLVERIGTRREDGHVCPSYRSTLSASLISSLA